MKVTGVWLLPPLKAAVPPGPAPSPEGSLPHGHGFEDPDMFGMLVGKLLQGFGDISRGYQGCRSNVFFDMYLAVHP